MPDYNLTHNQLEIVSGSIYLYPSSSKTSPNTAISASIPQILAVTCSSNLNSRLVPSNNTSSFSIISFSTGSNQQRLVLRYLSGSYNNNGKIKSVTPTKYLKKTTGTRDKYVDIPILNNDDSLTVAYKTVNALSKTGGFNSYFSASLETIGIDDLTTTGVGSIEIGNDFIVGSYPGGTGLNSFSSSLGINQSIGSTFRIRAGEGIGDIVIGESFIIDNYETFGTFKIFNYLSGSVGKADFSGSMVQVGGMKIGSSFKIGGSTQLFSHNIIQEGSGIQNQPFYPGDYDVHSASLGILIDPIDNISAMLTGSNQSASLYFSGSGKIGLGTTNPQTDVDIAADKFQIRARRESKGIFVNEEGNLESFNKTTEGASTGSEFIMSYARGGSNQITSQLIALVLIGGSNPGLGGRSDEIGAQLEADRLILEEGGLSEFINRADPDIIRKLIETGEELGILGTAASAGDVLGSIRWMADSGSFDSKYFDGRGGGEMLKIQGKVVESTDAGIKGDMIFLTTTNVANAPSEVMRIGSDGNVHITGSLNVTGDLTYEDTLVIHVTASGDISASGNIYMTQTAGTDNSVVVLDSNGKLVTDEIDGAVWGGAGAVLTVETDETAPALTAGTATVATNITAVATDDDAEFFIGVLDGASGTQVVETSTRLKQNPLTGKVTVTGDISASGNILGDQYKTKGQNLGLYHEASSTIRLADSSENTQIYGTNIKLDAPVTASGNISASGQVYLGSRLYVNNKEALDGSNTTLGINEQGDFTATQINRPNAPKPVILYGNVTASGNVEAATYISASEFRTTGHITASGNISSSGKVYSDNEETFHGSARITSLALNNYSGPNFQGIMRHEWTRKLTETVNDNNTIEINRQDIRTGIIIPYAFKITGFTMFYGVNKNGVQTIPQGALFALSQSQMDLNDNVATGDTNTITALCTGLGQGSKGYNSHLCTGSCDVDMPAGSSIYYRVKPTTTIDGTTMDMNYTIQWKRINE